MNFKVVLYESDEGFAVFCPGLQGCVSQGNTKGEALENVQSAIREYLEVCWIMFKRDMEKDLVEDSNLRVSFVDVEVDTRGVEEAESEQARAII